MRAPEAPNGCPIAMAPPRIFAASGEGAAVPLDAADPFIESVDARDVAGQTMLPQDAEIAPLVQQPPAPAPSVPVANAPAAVADPKVTDDGY